MNNKLDKLITSIEGEIKKPDFYPYLPEILEILNLMRITTEADKERKTKLIGGLMRLVTEDFEFSESVLGTEILEVANQYYESL